MEKREEKLSDIERERFAKNPMRCVTCGALVSLLSSSVRCPKCQREYTHENGAVDTAAMRKEIDSLRKQLDATKLALAAKDRLIPEVEEILMKIKKRYANDCQCKLSDNHKCVYHQSTDLLAKLKQD